MDAVRKLTLCPDDTFPLKASLSLGDFMGDSPKYRPFRPRNPYVQPGELDTALVEEESQQPRPTDEPNSNRSAYSSFSGTPESRPAAARPIAEWERKSFSPTKSKPSRRRSSVPSDPFYKGR